MPYKTYSEKRELLESRKLDLIENVEYFLNAIDKKKDLNAFNFVFPEYAIKQAEDVSKKIQDGKAGKLAGMVIAIKDVLSIEHLPMTCSSKMLKDFEPLYTATAVKRLMEADAIIIGKTNCDEFAMGSSNENSHFGFVRNPVDKDRVPGGSSGGSAVAVAANLCDVALGTDTGGSIRQPASFCGVYGLKPTYARVSRFGLTAFASSFDSIGPFTNSVEDAALCLQVMAGYDENDSTSAPEEVPDYIGNISEQKEFTVGLPTEYFGDGLDPEVKKIIEEKIEFLKSKGVTFKEIHLPHTEFGIATYYILTTAEASSNLARYDGARYGYRSEKSDSLLNMYKHTRSEGFGTEVKRRIMLGTYVLSAGYYDAYYRKAQKVRRLIQKDFLDAFKEVDVILTPTSPTPAFKIGEKSDDPLSMYLSDIYTTTANLAGIPGISIPVGETKDGLPVGLQLFANRFDEKTMLQVSKRV